MKAHSVNAGNFHEALPDISRCVREAQQEVGTQLHLPSEEVFLTENCHAVSPLAVDKLLALGWAATLDTRHTPGLIIHEYVRFPDGDRDDEIIADGTWGQFVESKNVFDGTPTALIGTRLDVINMAIRLGISKSSPAIGCWRSPSDADAIPRVQNYSEHLAVEHIRALLDE
jgi:hypothetical protein